MSYFHKTTTISCRESAIQMLSRRDHGEVELRNKLLEKGYEHAEVETTLVFCHQLGYIDDERFARGLLRKHIGKCHGMLRIRQEMALKQINQEVVDQVLSQDETDWFALARCAAEKKFDLSAKGDVKQYAKQVRYLQYRGFNFDQIQYALNIDTEQ